MNHYNTERLHFQRALQKSEGRKYDSAEKNHLEIEKQENRNTLGIFWEMDSPWPLGLPYCHLKKNKKLLILYWGIVS